MTNEDYIPFGQRLGFVQVDDTIQLNELNQEFRVDLWNFFSKSAPGNDSYTLHKGGFVVVFIEEFLREPSDLYTSNKSYYLKLREVVINGPWFRIYELIERFLKYYSYDGSLHNGMSDSFKRILVNNNSGYRMINGQFVPISSQVEIDEIKVLSDNSLQKNLLGLKEHLDNSLRLISQKPNPDLRNSIKESISMVEVVSRMIEPENTLGKALNKLDNKRKINPTLKAAFEKLYNYTNGENGVRHAILDSSEIIEIEEARFFLITYSAFANYLIEKAIKLGVIK